MPSIEKQMVPHHDNAFSTQLAYDLASGLWERSIILQKYGLSDEDWDRIRGNPKFRSIVKEAVTYWNGVDGIDRRIRAKARVMLEDSLPFLWDIASDAEKGGQVRMQAIDMMHDLTGAKEELKASLDNEGNRDRGGGISVIIDFGGGTRLSFDGQQPAVSKTIEHEE